MNAPQFLFPADPQTLRAMFVDVVEHAKKSTVPVGFGYLDEGGSVDQSHPVELWITCRMTYVFSLASMLGVAGSDRLAAHGVQALLDHFQDEQYGGWYSAIEHDLDEGGAASAIDGPKEAYAHAFVLLAANAAAEAGVEGAQTLLDRALENQDSRWWDEEAGRVVESYDRTFTETEACRGLNSNMHTVEAYLATADSTEDSLMTERALRILKFAYDQAAANEWRIPEHFDENWQPILDYNEASPDHPFRPYGVTPGHAFEWGRLMLHARGTLQALGLESPEWLITGAANLIMQAATDAWDVDGQPGFVYTTDYDGQPVVRSRMHWVAAEAIGAATVLLKVLQEDGLEADAFEGGPSYEDAPASSGTASGGSPIDNDVAELRSKLADYLVQWWDWTLANHLEAPGQWIHELDAQNVKADRTWQGKPDAYHVAQMLLLPQLDSSPTFAAALADRS